jgi:hypothetical protein
VAPTTVTNVSDPDTCTPLPPIDCHADEGCKGSSTRCFKEDGAKKTDVGKCLNAANEMYVACCSEASGIPISIFDKNRILSSGIHSCVPGASGQVSVSVFFGGGLVAVDFSLVMSVCVLFQMADRVVRHCCDTNTARTCQEQPPLCSLADPSTFVAPFHSVWQVITSTLGAPRKVGDILAPFKHHGYYTLFMQWPEKSKVTGKSSFLNKHGYLSADRRPLQAFYGAMALVYLLVAIVWGLMMACRSNDLLQLQYWIGVVLVLAMIEMTFSWADLFVWNSSENLGMRSQGLLVFVRYSRFGCQLVECACVAFRYVRVGA